MSGILNFLSHLTKGKPPDSLPSLTLDEYVALVAKLPPPTDPQKTNFIKFVSHSHSWYKHLPLCLPGVKFRFFIDPSAGCARSVTLGGRIKTKPRFEQGFHYSWIPTDEYRRRFGYLAYSCRAGTKAYQVKWNRIIKPDDDVAAIPTDDGRLYALPQEISRAGSVRLTAVIHNHSASCDYWDILGGRYAQHVTWPEESGGQDVLKKIIARGGQMRQEFLPSEERARINRTRIDKDLILEEPDLLYADPELYQLLAPEQRRQRSEMLKAIQRVCDLIYR